MPRNPQANIPSQLQAGAVIFVQANELGIKQGEPAAMDGLPHCAMDGIDTHVMNVNAWGAFTHIQLYSCSIFGICPGAQQLRGNPLPPIWGLSQKPRTTAMRDGTRNELFFMANR